MSTPTYKLPSEQQRKQLIKVQVTTNPHYGKTPQERTVNELLSSGALFIDKPSGPSSHQVTAWAADVVGADKAGHGGTLDPKVTGVLPIIVGDGTKAVSVLLTAGKEYVCVMKLHKDVDEQKIRTTCASVIGAITQMPPLRSAVKRVRRQRTIYYLEVLEIKNREVLFRVGCQGGTYIRTLCVDLGKKLGCSAHMESLRRTKVGCLSEHDIVSLQDVKDAYVFYKEDHDDTLLKQLLHPVEDVLAHVPKIVIRDSAVDALCHGADLAVPGVVSVDTDIAHGDQVAVMSLKGEAVAIGTALMSTEHLLEKDTGKCVSLQRVLMKKKTYPSTWKKT